MKKQILKKQISTAILLLLILFFAALDLESKSPDKPYISEKHIPIFTCPDNLISFLAPPVNITESQCTTVAAGGVVGAPTSGECPVGSSLQYRTDGSSPWSFDLPTYDQVTETNVYTRCICDMDNTVVSMTNVVLTDPATCPGSDGCPSGLENSLAPPVEIRNSSCMSGTVAGGAVLDPLTECPEESTIQYSLDEISWSTSLPAYDQTNSITIYSRCRCDMDEFRVSLSRSVITTPGMCTLCPSDLNTMTSPVVGITNSTCTVIGGTPSGGNITTPNTSCPTGSELQYSLDETTWTTSLPSYNQTTSITVYTRCNCEMDNSISSVIGEETTMPGTCPTTATCDVSLSSTTAPFVRITNSTCTVVGGTPSGGLLSAPTIACPTGSSIEYSINNGTTWSTTLPTYSQNTAITILTRCLCNNDNSMSSIVRRSITRPGTCPINTSSIPTMSQWGLIIFGLLVLNIGVIILYRLEQILV